MLTTFDYDEYVYGALKAGASAFLLKDSSPEQLSNAVRVVAAGDALLHPSITRRLIEDFARTHRLWFGVLDVPGRLGGGGVRERHHSRLLRERVCRGKHLLHGLPGHAYGLSDE